MTLFLSWAPVMKIAYFLCRTVLLSVACLVVTYFSTLSHKKHTFGEKVIVQGGPKVGI